MLITDKTLEQLELLKSLASAERKIVAENLKIKPNALEQRIHRLRHKITELRWFLKEIEKLERVHPHIKRMLLPTKAESDEES